MPELKVDDLLQEVSAEHPCGEDLEYDPDFIALEESARDKAAPMLDDGSASAGNSVDWAAVERQATALLTRTKDLRVALHLTRAALNTGGLGGFLGGLQLIHGYVSQYWDQVHPQLDAEEGSDPTQRINILESLSDPETHLRDLKSSRLIVSKTFGPISFRDTSIASGETAAAGEEGEGAPDPATINAAFLECDLEELRSVAAAAEEALRKVADIEGQISEHVPADKVPNFQDLTACLRQISSLLGEKLAQRAGEDGAPGGAQQSGNSQTSGSGAQAGPALLPTGQVTSREDVVRLLDMICDYYAKNEPSSPVPMLLQRAKRLVSKEFIDILRDLVPDAADQAEKFRGSE